MGLIIEDTNSNNIYNENFDKETEKEIQEQIFTEATNNPLFKNKFKDKNKAEGFNSYVQAKNKADDTVSLENILQRIDNITRETSYLKDAITSVTSMEAPDREDELDIIEKKCEMITRMVERREETNRRAIEFLDRMFDGLRPRENEMKRQKMDVLRDAINNDKFSNELVEMLKDL